MSFHSFMRCPFRFCIVAPSCVDLIPGASWAVVLSDVGTDAAGRAGILPLILVGLATVDRDPPGAMRPWQACLERKTFSLDIVVRTAQLFTVGSGELLETLLAAG